MILVSMCITMMRHGALCSTRLVAAALFLNCYKPATPQELGRARRITLAEASVSPASNYCSS